MGADIKKLRTRIKSVNSTLHLTKAMGLVASSKIRRANDAMTKGKEYENALGEAISELSKSKECFKSPYMQKRDTERVRIVCFAGDRGMAGGYNANIFRLMKTFQNATVTPVGKCACDKFGEGYRSIEAFSYKDAKELADALCKEFREEKFDKLAIVSTTYHSMMSQEANVRFILPLQREDTKKSIGMVFEPDEITVLNAMIPEFIAGILISAAKESFASEVAARRVAMDSAGKNAQEMLDELGLAYNRARQGSITQEITEIVAGSGL